MLLTFFGNVSSISSQSENALLILLINEPKSLSDSYSSLYSLATLLLYFGYDINSDPFNLFDKIEWKNMYNPVTKRFQKIFITKDS